MAKSKRFQSGREVFHTYIPDFEEEEETFDDDISSRSKELIEAILGDFGKKVERATSQRQRRRAQS